MADSRSLESYTISGRLLNPWLRLHGRPEPPLPAVVGMLAAFAILVIGCLGVAVVGLVALLQHW